VYNIILNCFNITVNKSASVGFNETLELRMHGVNIRIVLYNYHKRLPHLCRGLPSCLFL
jgi:hypothetical protein